MNNESSVLVLDAMGVLYQAADDVADLLVPFVQQQNPLIQAEAINYVYLQASLGRLDSTSFWTTLGLSPRIEDDYLSGHNLINGTYDFLSNAIKKFDVISCLSNDVSSWSLKLRQRFGLERWISTWVISGDVGYRKPSKEIYLELIRRLNVKPQQIVFVDDRPKNADVARLLGFKTVLFDQTGCELSSTHRCVMQLLELLGD